jgi:hypothetical protein
MVKEETKTFKGHVFNVTMTMADKEQAGQASKLFTIAGSEAVVADAILKVTGDLGQVLESCVLDADAMYKNDGNYVSDKYGYDERQALYNWWKSFKEMDKDLKKQKKFKEAKGVALVVNKALETSYNYYGIEAQGITDRVGTVIFSLLFYVVYTLWYGFAILFIFEGWGLRLEH